MGRRRRRAPQRRLLLLWLHRPGRVPEPPPILPRSRVRRRQGRHRLRRLLLRPVGRYRRPHGKGHGQGGVLGPPSLPQAAGHPPAKPADERGRHGRIRASSYFGSDGLGSFYGYTELFDEMLKAAPRPSVEMAKRKSSVVVWERRVSGSTVDEEWEMGTFVGSEHDVVAGVAGGQKNVEGTTGPRRVTF